MVRAALAALLISATTVPIGAAELSKTYSYFSIGGNNLDEIERDLSRRGPNVAATGQRHPGATRMEFKTQLNYARDARGCRLKSVGVKVSAKLILPRWKPTRKASPDTRFVWETLASDIKRHEEQHVTIAKNSARELEAALRGLGRRKTCQLLSQAAAKTTDRVLAKHDREQQRFDRVESAGFENRMLQLMESRLRRMKPS